jgi:surface polysaccharide O-acyltransferase-like enzyme
MTRNYTIDYVRFLSAFGVILIHLAPSTLIAEKMTAYFSITCVPFFLLTSLYLFQSKTARFDKINFSRILIPYASWSVIYLIFRTIKHLATNTSLDYDWFAIVFLGGSAVQLYFLPLLLCFLIAASAINTLFTDRDCKISTKVLAVLSIISLVVISGFLKGTSYLGFSNDFFSKILYYIFFSQCVLTLLPHLIKIRGLVVFCSVTSIFILAFLGTEHRDFSSLVLPLLSTAILTTCLMRPTYTVSKITNSILSTTYGVYLCHHLFIEGIEFSLKKFSINYIPYSIPSKLTLAFIVIILSILFVLFIRKWAVLAFLLLGETMSNKMPNKIPESANLSTASE